MLDSILKRFGYEKVSKSSSEDNKTINGESAKTPIALSSPEEIRLSVGDEKNDLVLHKTDLFDISNLREVYTTPEQSSFFKNLGSQVVATGTNAGILANSVQGLYRATVSPAQLMKYTNGTVSSIVKEGGKVTQHAGFIPASSASIFTPMFIFQVGSIITGQYYLNGINKQLKEISKKLDLIIQKIEDDKKGKILAAIEIRNIMAEQSAYTVDDMIRLRNAQDEILSIYNYYLLQLKHAKDNIHWEKDCWKTVKDVKETETNIRSSGFYEQLAMASQAYDLYTTFEIIYFKACLWMTQFDVSYKDKVISLLNNFQNYNKGILRHEEIHNDFKRDLKKYLDNRWNHADFYLNTLREKSNDLMQEARDKNNLFDEQARIRAVTENLVNSIQTEQELYIDSNGESTRLFLGPIDNYNTPQNLDNTKGT
ncbi:MAG: hypothetical protein K6G31_10385 [Paludibacteraceae bacterium]|nr:hypothetical protein [Paludibacteraceae bacterium]